VTSDETHTAQLKEIATALFALGYTQMSAAIIAVARERQDLRRRLAAAEERAETAERIIRNRSTPAQQLEDLPWTERLKRLARFGWL
jgi:hypothetical protein